MLNPWISIWRQPRATIEQIVATDPQKHVVAIAAVLGIARTLDRSSMRSVGDHMGLGMILGISLLVGPLFGVVSLYLWAALVRWTGRWFGGQATAVNIRAAIAWGCVPIAVATVLWIPQLLLAGQELFTSDTPRLDANLTVSLALAGMFVLELVAWVWSIVLVCKCLGQVQGFSAWKALGNSVLALLAIVVPLVAVAIAIGGLTR